MTCVVGIADGRSVWMGADSAGVAGWDITQRADPKVFRLGDMLIGFTTSFRMGQILRRKLVPPKLRGKDVDAYMEGPFIDAVRACLREHGYTKLDSGREEGGAFLAGVRGRIYRVSDDFGVGRSEGRRERCEAQPPTTLSWKLFYRDTRTESHDAIGCGAAYALGCLFACSVHREPRERAELALDAAAQYSAGVRGPHTILSIE